MDLPDVNVLMRAFRTDSYGHDQAVEWLNNALADPVGLALSELALSALIRIASNPGIAKIPYDKERVLAFAVGLVAHANIQLVVPGPRHFGIFLNLCALPGVHGKVVPDAYYAAMAIERGYRFVTSDRGFARFPGLDWMLLE